MASETVRILVVEDDLIDRTAFERFVKAEGLSYDYVMADSVQRALDVLADRTFDLLLADHMLPDGTSLDLLGCIEDLPLIVVTGTGDEETAVAAMKGGASDYVIKDPDGNYLKALPATVQNALERRRTEEELRRYREHLEELVHERTAALEAEIGERKRAEEERGRLQEQLHQAQKMEAVGQLAGGVAHDFNNLLTVIAGNAELVSGALSEDSPESESLRIITEAAHQATGVTRSLLTFSRHVATEKRPVDFVKAISGACRFLGRVLPASIQLELDAGLDPPLWVNADATQLQQVFMNLAINSRDAMPEGGRLRVSVSRVSQADVGELVGDASRNAGFARLAVSDTGAGMPADVLSRIFEPFFSTKPRGQGTGLGLSILHSIIKDHDGHIEAQSEVGVGTTFTIFFPCTELGSAGDATKPPLDVPRGRGETVLLAEDDRFARETTAMMLKYLGYEAIQAADGPALLELARQRRRDLKLIISDVDLPRRNGIDCLREMREGGHDVPAIVMTGRIDVDLAGDLDGRNVLLRKPFDLSQLGKLVSEMLSSTGAQEQST